MCRWQKFGNACRQIQMPLDNATLAQRLQDGIHPLAIMLIKPLKQYRQAPSARQAQPFIFLRAHAVLYQLGGFACVDAVMQALHQILLHASARYGADLPAMARIDPAGRGEEPTVRTIVQSQGLTPSSSQTCRCSKTSLSMDCINDLQGYKLA